jgi:hypothetical protein
MAQIRRHGSPKYLLGEGREGGLYPRREGLEGNSEKVSFSSLTVSLISLESLQQIFLCLCFYNSDIEKDI